MVADPACCQVQENKIDTAAKCIAEYQKCDETKFFERVSALNRVYDVTQPSWLSPAVYEFKHEFPVSLDTPKFGFSAVIA